MSITLYAYDVKALKVALANSMNFFTFDQQSMKDVSTCIHCFAQVPFASKEEKKHSLGCEGVRLLKRLEDLENENRYP